jgi:predicted GIY-YIG superfamily endonuclease
VPEPPERTALYRLYDADHDLLYIGISRRPSGRFKEHEYRHAWWHCVRYVDLTWFDTYAAAYSAEKAAHMSERPPYNGVGHIGLGWDGPSVRYDDSADFTAASKLILSDLKSGKYRAGKHLWALTISREIGYSSITTDRAMTDLARAGHLEALSAGYRVLMPQPSPQ